MKYPLSLVSVTWKNKLCLLFIFIMSVGSLQSQVIRFFYSYQFKPDSLHRDRQYKELMALDVIPEKGSFFYSYAKYSQDSLFSALRSNSETGFIAPENNFNAKIKFQVAKTYQDLNSVLFTHIGATSVNLKRKMIVQWDIMQVTDTINGYPVQKAVLDFQGRKWTAWFTSEIQIQDGPYCFYGLPGLIVKIEDHKGDHTFVLNGIKKLHSDAVNVKIPSGIKSISINENQFKKMWKNYKEDPAKDYRLRYSGHGNLNVAGQTVSKNEIIKKYEVAAIEKIKNENNFIELSMYH